MNLTYEIKENGYEIYKDGAIWVTQYEPYIPNSMLSYEENAIAQIEELNKPSINETTELETLKARIEGLEKDLADLTFEIAVGGV